MTDLHPASPASTALAAFVALCGGKRWQRRMAELGGRADAASLRGRAMGQRHALELALAKLTDPRAMARAGLPEQRLCAFAAEAVRLAASLPPKSRAALRDRLEAGLTGEATLIPLFHLLRTAALHRARGFSVRFTGLVDGTGHDLVIAGGDAEAEVVCETASAEEGRPLHRGDWCALVDGVNPELQTWLAAHPGRYILKMTLPEGITAPDQVGALQARISSLLQDQRRQDSAADAVLKLDPLVLAGAQAAAGLPARLRAQFGPEAHLAVTTARGSDSVFVMAARAGRENTVAEAVCGRLAQAAGRLSGTRPGILALFVEEVDRAEWRALREELTLEGAARRFLTLPAARPVVAVACTSRFELFGMADAAPGGELRFRNQAHPAAKATALAPAVLSSV